MKSVAEVLSDQNCALLRMIADIQPESFKELADAVGRQSSNLSRTLKTMEHYGFVEQCGVSLALLVPRCGR